MKILIVSLGGLVAAALVALAPIPGATPAPMHDELRWTEGFSVTK
jgi:hypothetical protein